MLQRIERVMCEQDQESVVDSQSKLQPNESLTLAGRVNDSSVPRVIHQKHTVGRQQRCSSVNDVLHTKRKLSEAGEC